MYQHAILYRTIADSPLLLGLPLDFLKWLMVVIIICELLLDSLLVTGVGILGLYIYGIYKTRKDRRWFTILCILIRVKSGYFWGSGYYVA